jgi:flavin reductase (DIM6/NTAB) family NADH-FMN oxidoreductase RutF
MKKFLFVMLAAFATLGAQAQDLEGFDKVNLQEEFADNAFTFFTQAPILLSGDKTASNAMTIGWGSFGNYLGYKRPTVTVYVAPGRYTYQFMERYPRFTVMEFDDPEIAKYMGSHSGRDGDKAAALGLHVAYTPGGTPYYTEAKTVIECEIITSFHQDETNFRNDTPRKFYKNFEAGIHAIYIGEVIGAWKKK